MRVPVCVKSSLLLFVPGIKHILGGKTIFGICTAVLGTVSVMNHGSVGGRSIQVVDRVLAHAIPAMYVIYHPTAIVVGSTIYCGSLFMYGKYIRRRYYPGFRLCHSIMHAHLHAIAAAAMCTIS